MLLTNNKPDSILSKRISIDGDIFKMFNIWIFLPLDLDDLQDYRIQELNKKLSKLQGDISMEEEDVHGTRIKMLEDELDKRNKLLQFTLNQHQRINVAIRLLLNSL